MNNIKKILIALDDGPAAEKVASSGLQLAQQLYAEIALISVADTEILIGDGGITPAGMAAEIKNELKENQSLMIAKVFKNHKVWTFIEEGNPYEMILKTADEWEADLIVLGTHGRTGLAHLFIGSVAEKVTRRSTKPLLIIPTKL